MSEIVTRNYRLNNAMQFVEMFEEADPTNMYLFIGKAESWPNENYPPSLSDTLKETVTDVWDTMLGMKKVASMTSMLSVVRIDWSSGETYSMYDDALPFNNTKFYVLTEDNNVYKCLYNNGGKSSTVKPSGVSEGTIQLSDGYIWKFMFSLSSSDISNFLTNDFIPVRTLTNNESTPQWDVQQSAISGAIHAAIITNAGTGYTQYIGYPLSVTSTTLVMPASASTVVNKYVGYGVYILNGTGAGQYRKISGYISSTRTLTVSTPWDVNPSTGSQFIVSPYVTIDGDGQNALAYSEVNTTGVGILSRINFVNTGTGYTRASITISSSTTNAAVRPVISPPGGHGSDAVAELYATNVTMNVRLSGNEGGNLFVGNEFRTIGLIVNPLLKTGVKANDSVYNMMTVCTASPDAPGQFSKDEVVRIGDNPNKTGIIVEYDNVSNEVKLQTPFDVAENQKLTGLSGAHVATATNITLPLLKRYSGLTLYVRTSAPTTRNDAQQENFRITAKF